MLVPKLAFLFSASCSVSLSMLASSGSRIHLQFGRFLVEGQLGVSKCRPLAPGISGSAASSCPDRSPGAESSAEKKNNRSCGNKLSKFDKKILLWSGFFKTEEEIPSNISAEKLNAARSKARIKVCCILIALTFVGCFAEALFVRKAADNRRTQASWNISQKAKLPEETAEPKVK